MTETMVEKVARALFQTWGAFEGTDMTWEEVKDAHDRREEFPKLAKIHDLALIEARAAIEEMRVPTKAMVEAGTEARWRSAVRDANSIREIWNAGIDAALKE